MKRGALGSLIFVLLIAVLAVVYVKRGLPGAVSKTTAPETKNEPQSFKTATSEGGETAAAAVNASAELTSVNELMQNIADNVKPDQTPQALIDYLTRTHQDPVVAHDKNEYTGEMTVIRTRNPAPGTRYFLAQFFSDEKGGSFPQHLSFESRAGADAFANGVAAVRKAFPDLGEADVKNDNFMQWNLKNGYVVWVKQLGPQDVEDDGVNPHSPEDVGTIWTAVELAPPEDAER